MTYEEFEKACYELAEKEPDPDYAKEGLDFAKKIGEIRRFYEEGYTVEETVYALCF